MPVREIIKNFVHSFPFWDSLFGIVYSFRNKPKNMHCRQQANKT